MDIKKKNQLTFNLNFLIPLAILYCTIYLAADSVAFKVISIGPTIEPGPPFIFPVSYVIGSIISEVYGSNVSKLIIWTTLLCQLVYATTVHWIINLPSPTEWHGQQEYNFVFGHIIHFVISGTAAVLISSFLNIYLIAKIKVLMKGKYFPLRSIISTGTGGFVLVLLIVVLVYYPILGIKKSSIMFGSIYFVEFIYTVILVWPSWLVCGLIKKFENIDVYDYKVKFNPFKFTYTKGIAWEER